MTRFTPAIFKSIPLLLLLISFCAINVLASPTLHQDIVYVSDNSSSIESAATSTDGKPAEGTDYTEENANVQQVAETPEPSGNVMVCKIFLFDESIGSKCKGFFNNHSLLSTGYIVHSS
jgi:hypothetical protein